jgi:hypothetical protein
VANKPKQLTAGRRRVRGATTVRQLIEKVRAGQRLTAAEAGLVATTEAMGRRAREKIICDRPGVGELLKLGIDTTEQWDAAGQVADSLDEAHPLRKREVKRDDARHRVSREHRKRCRAIAADMWKRDADRSIADVIRSNDIDRATERKGYNERRLREWVRDLCPNPRRGRPRKK